MRKRSLEPEYPGEWEYLNFKCKEVCEKLKSWVENGAAGEGAAEAE